MIGVAGFEEKMTSIWLTIIFGLAVSAWKLSFAGEGNQPNWRDTTPHKDGYANLGGLRSPLGLGRARRCAAIPSRLSKKTVADFVAGPSSFRDNLPHFGTARNNI